MADLIPGHGLRANRVLFVPWMDFVKTHDETKHDAVFTQLKPNHKNENLMTVVGLVASIFASTAPSKQS